MERKRAKAALLAKIARFADIEAAESDASEEDSDGPLDEDRDDDDDERPRKKRRAKPKKKMIQLPPKTNPMTSRNCQAQTSMRIFKSFSEIRNLNRRIL